jgi:hypothetical protein
MSPKEHGAANADRFPSNYLRFLDSRWTLST